MNYKFLRDLHHLLGATTKTTRRRKILPKLSPFKKGYMSNEKKKKCYFSSNWLFKKGYNKPCNKG